MTPKTSAELEKEIREALVSTRRLTSSDAPPYSTEREVVDDIDHALLALPLFRQAVEREVRGQELELIYQKVRNQQKLYEEERHPQKPRYDIEALEGVCMIIEIEQKRLLSPQGKGEK